MGIPEGFIRLHRADRVGLIVALFFAGCFAVLDVAILAAVGTLAYGRFDAVMAAWTLCAVAGIALPTWLALRGIDAVSHAASRATHSDRAQRQDGLARAGFSTQLGWQ